MPSQIPSVDRRLIEVRHLDATYEMSAPETKAAWLDRAGALRQQLRLALGLWPEPARGPLHPVVTGQRKQDGYSVENVYFESHPGFFVTGNLYRPQPLPRQRCPALLVAHGHWPEGRLLNHKPEADSMPGLCINIALRGGLAFSWDMIGYNDSQQLTHQFGKGDEQLALWGISLMGLQAFNSTRAVDFLLSLPEVDPARLACTGASGGGTQTFILSALDERVQASAPAVMVSSIMQGGCLCEGCASLRLGTHNMEIAALAAPRPQLLISCSGDWTARTREIEYPAIAKIYALFGAEVATRLQNYHQHAGHNYNRNSREALYGWLGRLWFGQKDAAYAREKPFQIDVERLRVFKDKKLPAGMKDASTLVAFLKAQSNSWIEARRPHDERSLKRFRYEIGMMVNQLLRVRQPQAGALLTAQEKWAQAAWPKTFHILLSRKKAGDRIQAVLFWPKRAKRKVPLVVLVRHDGSFGLLDMLTGAPGPLAAALLQAGMAVLALDTFEGTPRTGRRPRVCNNDACYNESSVCHRVQDILSAVAWARARTDVQHVDLVADGYAAAYCLLARTCAEGVRKLIVNANAFDSQGEDDYHWNAALPGLRRAGGLPAVTALCAAAPLFIHDTRHKFDTSLAQAAYAAAGAPEQLRLQVQQAAPEAQAQWLQS